MGDIRYDHGDSIRVGERAPFLFAEDQRSPRGLFEVGLELYPWSRLGIGVHWLHDSDSYAVPTALPGVDQVTEVDIDHQIFTLQLFPYISDDRALRWMLLGGSGSTAYRVKERIEEIIYRKFTVPGRTSLRGIILDIDSETLTGFFSARSYTFSLGYRIAFYRLQSSMGPGPAGETLDPSGDVFVVAIRMDVF